MALSATPNDAVVLPFPLPVYTMTMPSFVSFSLSNYNYRNHILYHGLLRFYSINQYTILIGHLL